MSKRKRNYKAEYARYGRANYLKHKAEHTTYYDLNKDYCNQKSREWVKKHPIKRRRIALAWYYRNREYVLEREKRKYWADVVKTRKKESRLAMEYYWKHPIKSRRKNRAIYWKNVENYRLHSSWSQFRRRYGLNLTIGKEQYRWLRELRKEYEKIRKAWKDGGTSETILRLHLRLLASRLRQK